MYLYCEISNKNPTFKVRIKARITFMSLGLLTTIQQYDAQFAHCKALFLLKVKDYGTSWRLLRLRSVTDQLYIKAKRIRTIDEKGEQRITDSIEDEFMGCVNYGIIALMQLELIAQQNSIIELSIDEVTELYTKYATEIRELMLAKNHDYGEAWRDMRISSFTDLILTKLHRIKQMEENQGHSTISEGVDANYKDIVNYAIFALIQFSEQKNKQDLV